MYIYLRAKRVSRRTSERERTNSTGKLRLRKRDRRRRYQRERSHDGEKQGARLRNENGYDDWIEKGQTGCRGVGSGMRQREGRTMARGGGFEWFSCSGTVTEVGRSCPFSW